MGDNLCDLFIRQEMGESLLFNHYRSLNEMIEIEETYASTVQEDFDRLFFLKR